MLHKTLSIIFGCILSLATASNGSATSSETEKAISQNHASVESILFPINEQDLSILGLTCFEEAEYVNVKQEQDAICFYFDYDKAKKDLLFRLKISAATTIASLTAMLAGLAGVFMLETKKQNLCLISAFIGTLGTLLGGTSTLLCALTISAQVPTDKPFRIINKNGMWDNLAGEIKWTDIKKIEVYHQEKALLDCLIITLLQKDKDGNAEKYYLYGTLGGLVVLEKFLLNFKEIFCNQKNVKVLTGLTDKPYRK